MQLGDQKHAHKVFFHIYYNVRKFIYCLPDELEKRMFGLIPHEDTLFFRNFSEESIQS